MNLDRDISEVERRAAAHAKASVYTMDNEFTTLEEKFAIECWFQLPLEVGSYVLLAGVYFSLRGFISGMTLYVVASGATVVTAALCWFVYNRAIVGLAFLFLNKRLLWWSTHLAAVILCFWWSNAWLGIFLLINLFTASMPIGIWGMLFNQMVTKRYKMHPKYAFLKHFHGKVYPFETEDGEQLS